jgi:hypothetical protein
VPVEHFFRHKHHADSGTSISASGALFLGTHTTQIVEQVSVPVEHFF